VPEENVEVQEEIPILKMHMPNKMTPYVYGPRDGAMKVLGVVCMKQG